MGDGIADQQQIVVALLDRRDFLLVTRAWRRGWIIRVPRLWRSRNVQDWCNISGSARDQEREQQKQIQRRLHRRGKFGHKSQRVTITAFDSLGGLRANPNHALAIAPAGRGDLHLQHRTGFFGDLCGSIDIE